MTQYAVWFREGPTGDPYVLADGMTREEADTLLSHLILIPGDDAGVAEYLPRERA